MREERIELSQRERDRMKVLHQVEQGYPTQAEAGQRVQVSAPQVRPGLRGARVEVELRLDGTLWVRFRGSYLSLRPGPSPPPATPFGLRPTGLAEQRNPKPKRKYIPPPDHPWRRTFLSGKKWDISTLRCQEQRTTSTRQPFRLGWWSN